MTKAAKSIPKNLLERFDCIMREKGHSSRNDAIRGGGPGLLLCFMMGVKRGLIEAIARLQQDFKEIICSTMLVPVNYSENDRLELLILKGEGKLIVALTEQMLRLNGVKYVKLTTIEHGAKNSSTKAVSPEKQAEEPGKIGLQDVKDELLLAAESMDMTSNHQRRAIERL